MPLSPNMNLPIPVPSQTGGPQYALDEQSCFQQIDSHNHTPGQGSLIPLNALNINQNLSMSGYSITSLKSLQLQNQAISPGSSSLYMSGNDLYFSDGTGAFNVQITSGNSVAVSGAVGFSGLPSGTASAAYLSVLGTFRFQSATNTAATLDVGPIKTRNTLAGSNYISLNAPNPLAGSYDIVLPANAPLSNKILQMGATGAIYNSLDVDNSTLQIVGNSIQVANAGITQTQLANNSVGTNQIINANVTRVKLGPLGQQVSASSGVFAVSPKGSWVDIPNLTITITTNGRPVVLCLNPDGTGNPSSLQIGTGAGGGASGLIRFLRDGNEVSQQKIGASIASSNVTYPSTTVSCIDVPAAGTHTYKVQAQIYNGAGYTFDVNLVILIGYEL